MNREEKERVYNFLLMHYVLFEEDIRRVEKIDTGYTNDIYHVTLTNGEELKLRFAATNPYINRELEKILETKFNSKDIIYWHDNGDYIKKWIDGDELVLKHMDNSIWEEAIEITGRIKNTSITSFVQINKPVYYDENVKLEPMLKEAYEYYVSIINSFSSSDFSLCHNDFSCSNILINRKNGRLEVFDFEWASYNHNYWDIANLIKDTEIDYEDLRELRAFRDFRWNLLIEIIFAVHFYSYFWTYKVEPNKKIIAYRKKMVVRTLYWFNVLKENIAKLQAGKVKPDEIIIEDEDKYLEEDE